jgi:hypothetical protein
LVTGRNGHEGGRRWAVTEAVTEQMVVERPSVAAGG